MIASDIQGVEGASGFNLSSTEGVVNDLSHFKIRKLDNTASDVGNEFITPFGTHYGRWFNHCLEGRGEGFARLTAHLKGELQAANTRERVRRQADEMKHFLVLSRTLSNALGVAWHHDPGRVAYSRRNGFYGDIRIWPEYLTAAFLGQVVHGLCKLGYLEGTIGYRGEASQFEATAKLLDLAAVLGVQASSLVIVMLPRDLVRMKAPRLGGRKKRIPCEQSEQVSNWASMLRAFNTFVADAEIDLDMSSRIEEGFIRKLRDKSRDNTLIRPELFATSLYRTFNDGIFDHGGRLFGGWWQTIPSFYRRFITIDGAPTIELDYSGFAIRSIYHQRGLSYADDPYHLEQVVAYAVELGLPPDHFRHAIKRMTQALLNGDETGRPELIKLDETFAPRFKRADIFRMLEEKHDPIADVFRTAEGKRNQRFESDIALEIITTAMGEGFVVLPIHDSFIVTTDRKGSLMDLMTTMYFKRLGHNPIIK